MEREKNIN